MPEPAFRFQKKHFPAQTAKSLDAPGKTRFIKASCFMVPVAGLEPARLIGNGF